MAGGPRRRGRRLRRPVLTALAVVCASGSLVSLAASESSRAQPGAGAPQPGTPATPAAPGSAELPPQIARGRGLFVEGCSSCHGLDARGIPGQAPSLVGAGAAAADFYLSTGRMPLPAPDAEPRRATPAYSPADIDALVAYVGSLGGPPIPHVDPAKGDPSEGLEAFTTHCAGCHQVVGQGGIIPGAQVPPTHEATPTQLAEAVRIGPYLMPRFSEKEIDQSELDSIARYVEEYTASPDDRGGWGIGNIGPIPEGVVAWLLAGVALLLVARLIGEGGE